MINTLIAFTTMEASKSLQPGSGDSRRPQSPKPPRPGHGTFLERFNRKFALMAFKNRKNVNDTHKIENLGQGKINVDMKSDEQKKKFIIRQFRKRRGRKK